MNTVEQHHRFITKKPSLSILSGSSINKLNNLQRVSPEKPLKERVVSKSTGLIKFSLGKTKNNDENLRVGKSIDSTRQGLPIYIPINDEKKPNPKANKTKHTRKQHITKKQSLDEETGTQDLFFKLASKQRKLLDLKEELFETEKEFRDLEIEYKKNVADSDAHELHTMKSSISKKPSILQLTSKIGKKASQLNLATNDITDNISKNLAKNKFFSKGKSLFANMNRENEKWINTQTQNFKEKISRSQLSGPNVLIQDIRSKMKQEDGVKAKLNCILSTIMENQPKDESFNEDESADESVDDYSQLLDYDMPKELKIMNDKNFEQKIRGTILRDEDKPRQPEAYNRDEMRCEFPSDSEEEEDYGGDAVPYEC